MKYHHVIPLGWAIFSAPFVFIAIGLLFVHPALILISIPLLACVVKVMRDAFRDQKAYNYEDGADDEEPGSENS